MKRNHAKWKCIPKRENFDPFSCNALALLSSNCNPKRAFIKEEIQYSQKKEKNIRDNYVADTDVHRKFPKT